MRQQSDYEDKVESHVSQEIRKVYVHYQATFLQIAFERFCRSRAALKYNQPDACQDR
jgi:hypothetical protein